MDKNSAPLMVQIPIEPGNPSVKRYTSACFHCGNCKWTCLDHTGIFERCDAAGGHNLCIYCGQCINQCPGFAMSECEEYADVKAAIKAGKTVIASVSPSLRVSLAESFGLDAELTEGKLVSLLKKLGFTYVLDTNFGADLTICEEATELVNRIENGGVLPQFTSCCPAWVRFAELFYPEYLDNISSAKSPICMQGAIIKTWFAKKRGLDVKNIMNVAVAPCTAKKYEIRRDGMDAAGKYLGENMRDMDNVITTRELAAWAKESGITYDELGDEPFDSLAGTGAAAIFGATGGVMEAALRTAYFLLNGENPPEDFMKLEAVRGFEDVREAEIDLKKAKINVAVIFGTKNAGDFIDKMKTGGKQYHFIEVMTCPGGCVGGGGQPKGFVVSGLKVPEARIDLLHKKDEKSEIRLSHENPEVKALYEEMLGTPCSEFAEKLLHTSYTDRSTEVVK